VTYNFEINSSVQNTISMYEIALFLEVFLPQNHKKQKLVFGEMKLCGR
jgi:hypothetical protein